MFLYGLSNSSLVYLFTLTDIKNQSYWYKLIFGNFWQKFVCFVMNINYTTFFLKYFVCNHKKDKSVLMSDGFPCYLNPWALGIGIFTYRSFFHHLVKAKHLFLHFCLDLTCLNACGIYLYIFLIKNHILKNTYIFFMF